MSEIKLKLCPFCGGEAKLRRINGRIAYVECSKCCTETNHFEMSVEYCANEKIGQEQDTTMTLTIKGAMSMNSVTARIVAQRLRSEAMTKINATQILPIAMILLDVGAAAVCLWHRDYRRVVYWVAAAVLNVTVTF